MARHFGFGFVLALVQRFEAGPVTTTTPTPTDNGTPTRQIHEEVIRALAARGRDRLSGSFRAAVFSANDGLVSKLASSWASGASGVSSHTVLVIGLAALAGALSMGGRIRVGRFAARTAGGVSAERRCRCGPCSTGCRCQRTELVYRFAE